MQDTDTMTHDTARERAAAILRLREDARKRREEARQAGACLGADYVRDTATLEDLDDLLSEDFDIGVILAPVDGAIDDPASAARAWGVEYQEAYYPFQPWMLSDDCAEPFWRGFLEGVREEWDRIKSSVYVD